MIFLYAGGIDVKNLDPLWFRTKISLVSQEPTLFACSIRENIAYGTSATDEQVVFAISIIIVVIPETLEFLALADL